MNASSVMPRFPRQSLQHLRRRPFRALTSFPVKSFHSNQRASASATALAQEQQFEDANELQPEIKPPRPLSQEQRKFLDGALRVNQAGELAAIVIYGAQTPPIVCAHPHLKPLMKHMYDQESGHLKTFNEIIAKNRIRPTMMHPVWRVAATALGWGTAMMGREAAMACTEAVETEIGQHYNDQVRMLLQWAKDAEGRGEELGPELQTLLATLRRIRDEELEHLDHAVVNDAKEAQPYELLTKIIRTGCRGAIWMSERV